VRRLYLGHAQRSARYEQETDSEIANEVADILVGGGHTTYLGPDAVPVIEKGLQQVAQEVVKELKFGDFEPEVEGG